MVCVSRRLFGGAILTVKLGQSDLVHGVRSRLIAGQHVQVTSLCVQQL